MMEKVYENIAELIKRNLKVEEDDDIFNMINKLKNIKKKGYLTKDEFMEICMWKSPRPKKRYLSNSEDNIISVSKEVLSTKFEKRKIELLTTLKGVSIPTASAILTIINHKKYGIIDIRAWQTLYLYEEVKKKPSGMGFNFNDWYNYLMKLRYYAKRFKVSASEIGQMLFFHHKKIQVGTLYKK